MEPSPELQKLVYAVHDSKSLEGKFYSAQIVKSLADYHTQTAAELMKLSKKLQREATKETE